MLWDRGYAISRSDIDQTLADFRSSFGENPELAKIKIEAVLLRDPSKRILVVFCGAAPVKLTTARDLSTQYSKENWSRMILVLQSNMTSQTREKMKLLFPFKVESFHVSELLINITKHALMPNHEPLSEEEKQKLLKKYSIEETQLPRMLESDAVAKYYGYEKGTILKITYGGDAT
ncbi:uncharacterized protein A4U43_C01F28400 [Asparagus officinalis]|uniref:RNA polymerase subunit H/Rpb5 C-terminal domain-containing protein n=1 Tax=Asparagus officinalis TaxID=4686 RepID=A0A5P1FT30_ASPOF|nr:uncharacterized protein A4U43_C01F28400 [Asparagus officinalis]